MKEQRRTGMKQLREAVSLLNNTRESFNDRFSVHELISIAQAYTRSEWDITPDQWTTKEVEDAIDGKGTGATGDCLCIFCFDARPAEGKEECARCLAQAATEDDTGPHCPDADV
jgi:hypothetical protein